MKHHYPDCQGGPDCECDERERREIEDDSRGMLFSGFAPVHKFNGGRGATLCRSCRVIITEGLSDRLYCDSCHNEHMEFDL